MLKNKNRKKNRIVVFLKVFIVVFFIVFFKIFIDRSFSNKQAAATTFFDYYLSISGEKSTVEVGETQTLTVYIEDDYGDPAYYVTALEDAIFSIDPSADANCDGLNFGESFYLEINDGFGYCELQINTPGVFEIDLEGYEDEWWSYLWTGSSEDYHVTVLEAVDHLKVEGFNNQVSGSSQTITILAKNSTGDTITHYTGDKNITLSGANSDGSKIPTCTNKNGNLIDLGSPTTLTFNSGIATCDLVLYKLESAEIDATDGSVNSYADPNYDLDIDVEVGYLKVEGNNSQVSGQSQIITVSARNYNSEVINSYSGVKSMEFSGPISEGSNYPKCKDKNGSFINFGSGTELDFSSGEANCEMVLYKVEDTHIDVTDGVYDSYANSDYDLDVTVTAAPTPPNIYVDPLSIDYGSLSEGKNSESMIFIKNTGEEVLAVSSIALNGDIGFNLNLNGGNNPCGAESFNLNYNQSCTISVFFQPNQEGNYSANLAIQSNDPDNSLVTIDLNGNQNTICDNCNPNIYVDPLTINYGNLNEGENSESMVFIKNTGEEVLAVSSIALNGDIGFSLNLNGGSNPCGRENFNLNYNQSCTISVFFQPNQEGSYNGNLVIQSNDPDNSIVNIVLFGNEVKDCDHFELEEHKDNKLVFDVCIDEKEEKSSPEIDDEDNENTGIEKIKLKTKEKIEGKFEVEYLLEKPENLTLDDKYNAKQYINYKYLKFKSNDFSNDDLDDVFIDFLIDLNWREENDIAYITFLQSEAIGELDAELEGSDSTYSYFEARANSLFPYWVILGIQDEFLPKIYVNFLEHQFRDLEVNEISDPAKVEISNIGGADLEINRIFLEDINQYSINRFPNENPCGEKKSLSPDQSCNILIIFEPKIEGNFPNVLLIESNDPVKSKVEVNFQGKTKTSKIIPETKAPIIELSLIEHEFSEINLSNTKSPTKLIQDVIVYNKGNAELLISDIDLSNKDEYEMNLNPPNSKKPCGQVNKLDPGQNCELRIIFKPKKEGKITAVLNVRSNDPSKPLTKAVFQGKAKASNQSKIISKSQTNKSQVSSDKIIEENSIDKNLKAKSKESRSSFPETVAIIFSLMGIPFYQRRLKKAGVIFDAGNGKPLENATVELFGSDGKVKEVKSTDKTGNYFFLVTAGDYNLRVLKNGYKMLNEKEAKYFSKFYKPFITQETKVNFEKDNNFSFAFPMIPEDKKPFYYSIFSKSGWLRIQDNLFWIGLLLIIIIVLINPVFYNFIILGIYLLFILIKFFYPKKPQWGVVRNKENHPQPLVYINAKNKDDGNVVRGITDGEGRYALFLPKGNYEVEAKDNNGRQTKINIKFNKEKILVKDLEI
jgi:hypothetical protein